MDTKPANERSIHIGGLMRCCIQTIRESEEPTTIGDTLRCRYGATVMQVSPDGNWRWAPELDDQN